MRSRLDIAVCLLLGLAAFAVYNMNFRAIPAADTYAARYMPFSLWRSQTVFLEPIADAVAQGRIIPKAQGEPDPAWWVRYGADQRMVSLYPIVTPIVVAPLYLPAVLYLQARGWEPLLLDHVARIMEKLCASLLAAASVVLVYLLLRRRADPQTAALLALVYAFGTTTWVISSQALWTHGLAQVLVAATLLLLTGPATPLRAAAAGFFCALIACNRQPDAILAAGLAIYGLRWAGRSVPLFILAGALPGALLLFYNLVFVGHVVGAYGLLSRERMAAFINKDVLEGVAGMLFSPTRGLVVFSPFLLFLFAGMASVFRDRSVRILSVALCATCAAQIVFYALGDWRQGASFGPRWLTDMLPILFWMLPPAVAALSARGRVAFGLACVAAVAVQIIGAFWYVGVSDAALFATHGRDRMRAAWDIRNAPFVAELKHAPAPADLFVGLAGHIDRVVVHDAAGSGAERRIEVQGWTLADARTPRNVTVRVDGRVMGSTGSFLARPDVARARGSDSASGWSIAFPAKGLAPGEHKVSVIVQTHDNAEPRLFRESSFTLAADDSAARRDRDLARAAQKAAKILAERQQGPGYWLTAFTSGTRYEQPRPEMNTFTNAVILDVIDPITQAAGLGEPAARARAFLASQIEADGLVRYHGRPDAPTIGVLGCAITPDSDDTALVWRIAPGGPAELRSAALATLAEYRTADGLYRTWLAPRNRFACIDPGKDPNPPDIAIQIHILMWLAEADPPAARALCTALQRRAGDESIWVYYKIAPLITILRLRDLRALDCPLSIPPAWLETTTPGQAVWVEAFQRLQAMDGRGDETRHAETAAFLLGLADDDFSLLARDPPLLYHNDLTASVRRFYWSEELAYAAWLRLYFENESMRPGARCRGDAGSPECAGK